MMEAYECDHPRTIIVPRGDEKVETCRVCETIVDSWSITETYVCGSTDTASGEQCRRAVSSEDETCWQH